MNCEGWELGAKRRGWNHAGMGRSIPSLALSIKLCPYKIEFAGEVTILLVS
jgi:hypothetical protein